MWAKPTSLPGKSISRPDRPNSKPCPHCRRNISSVIWVNGKTVCPYCQGPVKLTKLGLRNDIK